MLRYARPRSLRGGALAPAPSHARRARAPPVVTDPPRGGWVGRRGGRASSAVAARGYRRVNAAPRLRVAPRRSSLFGLLLWGCCPREGDHPPAPPVGGGRTSRASCRTLSRAVRLSLLLDLPAARAHRSSHSAPYKTGILYNCPCGPISGRASACVRPPVRRGLRGRTLRSTPACYKTLVLYGLRFSFRPPPPRSVALLAARRWGLLRLVCAQRRVYFSAHLSLYFFLPAPLDTRLAL